MPRTRSHAWPAIGAAARDEMDADTVNRELSIARKTIGWGRPRDGSEPIPRSGSSAARRRRTARRRCRSRRSPPCGNWTRPYERRRTYWEILYESAARAEQILCLNIEELFPADKRGRVMSESDATEWIPWQSLTAQLLPRLIAGRTRGSLFLTDRKAPVPAPTLDACPVTGRATRSYRRAEELRGEQPAVGQPPYQPQRRRRPGGGTLGRQTWAVRCPFPSACACSGMSHPIESPGGDMDHWPPPHG